MGVLQQEIVTIGPTGDYPSISAANLARSGDQKDLSARQIQLVYEIEAGANGLGTSPATAKFRYSDGWRTNGSQGFCILIRPAEGNKYLGTGTPDLSLSHLKIDNSGAADIDQAAVYAEDVTVQIENLQIVTTTDSATLGAVNLTYDFRGCDYSKLQSCLVHVTYTAAPTGSVAQAAGVYVNEQTGTAVHGCIIYVDFDSFCGGKVFSFECIGCKQFTYNWVFNCTIISDNATGSVSGTFTDDTWRFANCYAGHMNSSAVRTAFDGFAQNIPDLFVAGSCASDDLTSGNVTNLPADFTTFANALKATLDLTPLAASGLRDAGSDVSQSGVFGSTGQTYVPNVQDVRTVGQPVNKVYDIGAVEYTATPPVSPTPAPPAGPTVPADVLYRQRVSPRGRAVRVVEPLRNDERTHNPQLDLTYDASNRLQRLQKTLQNGDRIYVDLTYDAAGNLSSVTRWQELVVP
jgi:hypothetical protein